MYLPENGTEARAVVQQLKQDKWVDRSTRAVIVSFNLYNANTRMLTVRGASLPAGARSCLTRVCAVDARAGGDVLGGQRAALLPPAHRRARCVTAHVVSGDWMAGWLDGWVAGWLTAALRLV